MNNIINSVLNLINTTFKKIFIIILVFLSTILIFTGFFGIYYFSANNNLTNSKQNSNSVEIQTEVVTNNLDTSINTLAATIYEQLDYFGFLDTTVKTVGNDQIIVDIPFSNFTFLENPQAPFSLVDQQNLSKFSSILTAGLFYSGSLQVKSIDGQDFFVLDENNNISFNDGTNGTPGLVPPATTTTPAYTKSSATPTSALKPASFNVFDYAYVNYQNGSPYIQLRPVSDYVYWEIVDGFNYLIQSQVQEALGVTFWLGYDIYEQLVIKYDSEGYQAAEQDLYTYAHLDKNNEAISYVRPSAKPFLVLDTKLPYLGSMKPYNNVDGYHVVDIHPYSTTLTVHSANLIATRINYSAANFKLKPVSASIIFTSNSNLILKVFYYLFLSFIFITLIFIIWYLGLLGIVAATFLSLFFVSVMAFVSFAGFAFSPFLLITIGLGYLMSIMLTIGVANIFRNNLDENLDSEQKYRQNLGKINKKYAFIFFIFIVFFGTLAFFTPTAFAFQLYLIFYLVISLGIYTFIILPLLFLAVDKLTDFSFKKSTSTLQQKTSWHYSVGYNVSNPFEIIFLWKTSASLAKNRRLSLFVSVSVLVSILLFAVIGIVMLTGNSAFNNTIEFDGYYQYNAVWTIQTTAKIPDSIDNSDNGGYSSADPFDQQNLIDNLNSLEVTKIVNDAFKSVDAKIVDKTIVRRDYINYDVILDPATSSVIPTNFNYTFAYGLQLTTKTELTVSDITTINDQLALALYPTINTWANDNDPLTTSASPVVAPSPGYLMIEESGSYSNGAVAIVNNYSDYLVSAGIMFGLLAATFLTLLFILLYLRAATTLAILSSTFFEIVSLLILFIIFWVPFGVSFFIGLSFFVLISLLTKLLIAVPANRMLISNKNLPFEEFENQLRTNHKRLLNSNNLIALSFVISTLFIASIAVTMFWSLFAVALFGFVIIFLFNSYYFINCLIKLNHHAYNRRNIHRDRYLTKITHAKTKNHSAEELIEGINC